MKTDSLRSMKVLFLTLGNGINIIVNFLTLPYLVRSLSYEEYGSYGQVLILVSLLQGVFTFNLNQVANLAFSKHPSDPGLVFSSLMRTSFLMGLLSVLLLLLISPVVGMSFDNPMLPRFLALSTLSLAAQVPVPVLLSVLIFHDRVKESTLILVVTNLVKVAAMFVSIHFLNSVEWLFVGIGFSSLIQLILLYFSVPRSIRTLSSFDKSMAAGLLAMASPLVLSAVIERGVIYLDGVMVSTMLSTMDFAIYRAGAIEVPFISAIYGSVAAIVMPEIARMFSDGDLQRIVQLKRRAVNATAFLVYPVLIYLLIFSAPLITYYLSDRYSGSAIIFAIFSLALFVRVNDYQDVIIVSGNSRFIFMVIVVMLLFCLLLNVVFISQWGVIGAAWAYIVFLFTYAGILLWKTASILECRISDIFDFPTIMKVLLISLACAAPLWLIYEHAFRQLWIIVIGTPVYLFAVYGLSWRFGLIEKEMVNRLVARLPLVSKFKPLL